MARTTPEEAFAEARAAIGRGDWEAFFACLDRDTLLRIGGNSVTHFVLGGDATAGTFAALCREHDVAESRVDALRASFARIVESARAGVALPPASGAAEVRERSLRHKQVVDDSQRALADLLRSAPDLGRFVGALERAMRSNGGGGSVSSRLLVDEVLEDVSITGDRAWGTRRTAGGHGEDVGFVRRKGQWALRILAQRPRGKGTRP